MVTSENAPAAPGYVDRLRAWIAKVFGAPAGVPHSLEPASAGAVATSRPGQSADEAMRMMAPHRVNPAT